MRQRCQGLKCDDEWLCCISSHLFFYFPLYAFWIGRYAIKNNCYNECFNFGSNLHPPGSLSRLCGLLMLSSSWLECNSTISAPLNTYNSQPMKILSERASSLPGGFRVFFNGTIGSECWIVWAHSIKVALNHFQWLEREKERTTPDRAWSCKVNVKIRHHAPSIKISTWKEHVEII